MYNKRSSFQITLKDEIEQENKKKKKTMRNERSFTPTTTESITGKRTYCRKHYSKRHIKDYAGGGASF